MRCFVLFGTMRLLPGNFLQMHVLLRGGQKRSRFLDQSKGLYPGLRQQLGDWRRFVNEHLRTADKVQLAGDLRLPPWQDRGELPGVHSCPALVFRKQHWLCHLPGIVSEGL